tara:strand:- start:141 stop:374 length:234 start_codon:yes stop_codon:yes gene_type:complete
MVSKNLYVDPLGAVINNENHIGKNYVNNYKKNKDTIKARIDDIGKKFESTKYELTIWSILGAIFILILLMLLRNINN